MPRATSPGVWSSLGASPPATILSTLPRLCSTLDSGRKSASSATRSTVRSGWSTRLCRTANGSLPKWALKPSRSISSSLVIGPPDASPDCHRGSRALPRGCSADSAGRYQQRRERAAIRPQPVDHLVVWGGTGVAPCRRRAMEYLDKVELELNAGRKPRPLVGVSDLEAEDGICGHEVHLPRDVDTASTQHEQLQSPVVGEARADVAEEVGVGRRAEERRTLVALPAAGLGRQEVLDRLGVARAVDQLERRVELLAQLAAQAPQLAGAPLRELLLEVVGLQALDERRAVEGLVLDRVEPAVGGGFAQRGLDRPAGTEPLERDQARAG